MKILDAIVGVILLSTTAVISVWFYKRFYLQDQKNFHGFDSMWRLYVLFFLSFMGIDKIFHPSILFTLIYTYIWVMTLFFLPVIVLAGWCLITEPFELLQRPRETNKVEFLFNYAAQFFIIGALAWIIWVLFQVGYMQYFDKEKVRHVELSTSPWSHNLQERLQNTIETKRFEQLKDYVNGADLLVLPCTKQGMFNEPLVGDPLPIDEVALFLAENGEGSKQFQFSADKRGPNRYLEVSGWTGSQPIIYFGFTNIKSGEYDWWEWTKLVYCKERP